MNKLYPGIALIGSEETAGIYGVNGGIIDSQGTGIQHLFYKDYENDLIHSACTMIKIGNTLYYGNRKHSKNTHPIHLKPSKSYSNKGFKFIDEFSMEGGTLTREDSVYAYADNIIMFETKITNNKEEDCELEMYTYTVFRNSGILKTNYNSDAEALIVNTNNRLIGIKADNPQFVSCIEESTTGFLYRTAQALFYNEEHSEKLTTSSMAGILCGKKIKLLAGESYNFRWNLVLNNNEACLKKQLKNINLENCNKEAIEYWSNWINKGKKIDENNDYREQGIVNIIAVKAALLNGFIPADLTGHYYSKGSPCYYARDSMMAARALLIAGHYREFEEVMNYLVERPVKRNGEFYQRYNGIGQPSEGANNNVFHQLDSLGYFARNIREYYKVTGKMILEYDKFKNYINILMNNKRKNGMIGPEGGVNEGVFGPAYITSSNMVIYGGLKAAIEIAEIFNDSVSQAEWKKLSKEIYEGIQTTLINVYDENNIIIGRRYCYGYVDYNNILVKKYDAPQYFGFLYGYENDEGMRATNKYYIKQGSFFTDGIGYSEQEYHHGPWIFNTAACAEYLALTGDKIEYDRKVKWLIEHGNSYGQMPEAIDANNEGACYINPLTWACAEVAAAIYINL